MGQNNSTVTKPPGPTTDNQENQPPRRLGERFGVLARTRAGPGDVHDNVPPAEFVAAVSSPPVAAHGSMLAPVVVAPGSISGPAPVLAAAPMTASAFLVAASGGTAVTVPAAVDNMNPAVAAAAPGSNAPSLSASEAEAAVPVVKYLNSTALVPASGSVASLGSALSSSSGYLSSVPASGNFPPVVFVRIAVAVSAPHDTSAVAATASVRTALRSARQTAPGPEPSVINNSAPANAASGRHSFLPGFAFGRLESPDNNLSAAAASGSMPSSAAVASGGELNNANSAGAAPGQPGTPLAASSAGEATPSPSRIQPSRRAKSVAPGSYLVTPYRQRDRRAKRVAREGEEEDMATPPSSSSAFAEKRKRDEIEEARPFKRRVSERLIRKSPGRGSLGE